jgi:Mannosyltransferase (PIG-V)
MSRFGIISEADDASAPVWPDPADAGRRRALPTLPQLPLPLIGMLIYAGIRVTGVALTAVALRHGSFRIVHWSLMRWLGSADGGHYLFIAAHGYTYPAGQLAHASVFSWFPGYPAFIDAIAWLPGVSLIAAALIVTAVAGLAAAWGLTTLGLRITADPRVSLLMVAIFAVAPGAAVLSMVYAEALFCALTVWALVALVDRRWLTAAGLTAVAGTVRSTAAALVAAFVVAALIALIQAARTGQRFGLWWRPLVAAVLAPLGLVGYLGYVAVATHRLSGWFWVEKYTCHIGFDWGISTLRVVRGTFLTTPSVADVLVVLTTLAAVGLALWGLTERIPAYLHVYTFGVVFMAVTTSANWIGGKPRFLLPAMLLALPVGRLLAPLRTSVLVGLIVILTGMSTWFGLYLHLIARWAP